MHLPAIQITNATDAEASQIARQYDKWCRDRGIDLRARKVEDCKTIDEIKSLAKFYESNFNDFAKQAMLHYYEIQTLSERISKVK